MSDQDDEQQEPDNPPAGFQLLRSRSLYSRRLGPFYFRADEDCFRQGVRVGARHCNGEGVVHGGMLTTLADNTMAAAVYAALGTRALTIQMNLQFMSAVKPGAWLEVVVRVSFTTQTMVFCEADMFVGDRLVMKATGIFRRPRQPTSEPRP